MVIYTLSSTDPEHYNRIQAKLPIDYTTSFVNLTVTSLTSNCNIEVMNDTDYITFNIDGTITKVSMKPYSKLTTASLPYVLQDIFTTNNIDITASISDLDTLILSCDKPFTIVNMSYNMKLITGFYYTSKDQYPIQSIAYKEEYIIHHENKPLTAFSAQDLNIKKTDTRPIQYTLTPPDAYGYNIQLTSKDPAIAQIDNGLIYGVSAGETVVQIDVRNPDTLLTSAPDFTTIVTVRVVDMIRTKIDSVSVPEKIVLYTDEYTTIYPDITPVNAGYYIESWFSDRPEIASVVNGYIKGISTGIATITYTITNNLESETQEITKEIVVEVKSTISYKTVYKIDSLAVGYMLSTPILYLITSIGTSVFFNEMQNKDHMQCGSIAMILNNSYSSSFPIVQQQNEIITRAPLNYTSSVYFWLVDANMQEVKLLNPIYITIKVEPVDPQVLALQAQTQQIQQT